MYRFIRSVRKVYTHSLHILVTVGNKTTFFTANLSVKKVMWNRELKVSGAIIKFIKNNNFHNAINRPWENDSRDSSSY